MFRYNNGQYLTTDITFVSRTTWTKSVLLRIALLRRISAPWQNFADNDISFSFGPKKQLPVHKCLFRLSHPVKLSRIRVQYRNSVTKGTNGKMLISAQEYIFNPRKTLTHFVCIGTSSYFDLDLDSPIT